MNKTLAVQRIAWLMSGLTVFLAVMIWGQTLRWSFGSLSAYSIFPVLGLIAFGLMWTHYMMAVLRQHYGVDKKELSRYFETTSIVVLAAILLHPGLLIFQLWRDGLGLPPNSYLQYYVAPTMQWAVLLGSVSLVIFLLFELRRKFSDRTWWKYVVYAQDGAMIAVYIHGLQLGRHLQSGWFRGVWLFYGISLAIALVYTYVNRLKPRVTE
jgi:hypothetical protein